MRLLLANLILFAAVPVAAGTAAPRRVPFLWGAATSSYQVEGGIDCSSSVLPCDDYDFFNGDPFIQNRVRINSSNAGPALSLVPAGIADDAWNPAVYVRDFDNARLLGLNALRISLEWARIEPVAPTPNADGSLTHHWNGAAIKRYIQMIDAMRVRGLTPIVTLNHFTLPLWVLRPPRDSSCVSIFGNTICFALDSDPGYKSSLRGWDNPVTIDRYEDFVRRLVPVLQKRVDYWLTINEPAGSQVVLGYVAGVWSPGFASDGGKAQRVLHNLIEAHVRGYDAITELDRTDSNGDGVAKLVGFAHAMGPTIASPLGFVGNAGLNEIAAANFDYFFNDYFVNAVTKGEEDVNYLTSPGSDRGVNVISHDDWKHHLDFLGINTYRRFHIYHDDKLAIFGTGFVGGNQHNNLYGEPEPHELLNDLGWAMYPQGLYEMIMRATNQWNLPVLVTENGIPERNDRQRAALIVGELRQVARARADGATVLGYLYWSLMDNWELQEGYHPQSQFGLFHIDRKERAADGKLALHRTLTEGGLAYKQAIDESRIDNGKAAPTVRALANVQSKFGALAADGSRIVPPSRTHGRFWEGTTNRGPITLYVASVTGNRRTNGLFTGLIFFHNLRRWHNVALAIDRGGVVLRETRFDDAAKKMRGRKTRVTYARGRFKLSGGTLSRVPGAGLWLWNPGDSPWGTDFFYVSKVEDAYMGKYLTFSSPGPRERPDPRCGAGGCLPQVAGNTWKAFNAVAVEPNLRLVDGPAPDGAPQLVPDREGESLFDISLALSNGGTTATTSSVQSGSFTTSKAYNVADAHFHLTGYVSPAGDNTWIGERDGSTTSKFRFLENRGIFQEFPTSPKPIGGVADQYWKENDPTSVVPLVGFDSRNGIRWSAGGRSYSIVNAPFGCLSPFVCDGSWSDVSGLIARRVPERFPPLVGALLSRKIEATTSGGTTVTIAAPPARDLDGRPLRYAWAGLPTSATGPVVTTFLRHGSHRVCVTISNGVATARRCATIQVTLAAP